MIVKNEMFQLRRQFYQTFEYLDNTLSEVPNTCHKKNDLDEKFPDIQA